MESARRGLPADDVERVIRMVDRAEYKRRQALPGIKTLDPGVGRDRRLPITNRYVSCVLRGRGAALSPRPEHELTLYGKHQLCGRSIPSPAAGPPLRREQHAERSWSVCREPASALRPHRHRHPRDRAQPAVSSSKVTSQTQVVRPRWIGNPSAWTVPSVAGA